MKLREKTLIAIAAILILILGSLAIFSYIYTERSYQALEADQALQSVNHVSKTLKDSEDSLSANLRDYAAWNDTYRFVTDRNQVYIDANMRDQLFTLYDIDYVLVFNRSGTLVYSKGYDPGTEQAEPLPDSLVGEISSLNEVQGIFASDHGTTGYLNSSIGPVLLASHPVLTDTFQGPAAGSMHMVRRINDRYTAKISSGSGSSVRIIAPSGIPGAGIPGELVTFMSGAQPVGVFPGGDTVTGVTRIGVLGNGTPLLLEESGPRTIYQDGHASAVVFLGMLLIASSLIVLLVILLFDRVVFSRLNGIIRNVQENTEKGPSQSPRKKGCTDELGELAEAIDPVFRKLADSQARIRESEELYRAIVSTSPEGIVIMDATGKILFGSPRVRELFRAPEDLDMHTIRITDWVDYSELEDVRDRIRQVLAGEISSAPWECRLYRFDHTRFWAEIISAPLFDDAGKPTGLLSIIRDVSSIRDAKDALRESEKRYRDLFEINKAIMLLVDPVSLRILDANAAACQYYGYTHDEITALSISDINIAGTEFIHNALTHAVEEDGTMFHFQHRKKNGEIRQVEVFSAPISINGKIVLHSIIQDSTERILAEVALREVNKKLNLLSGITRHDIQNQISALESFLEISLMSVDDPVMTRKFIEREEKIARNIANQISFTRDYEDLGVKAPVWQNINKIIRKNVVMLPMGNTRIDINGPDFEVYADSLLEKVFYNLIDNALKYGGDRMTAIHVSSREDAGKLVVLVEDDGNGISADDKTKLFEKGFGKNTGLGLWLSREILSITGITITENGEPGKGARFGITVPEGAFRLAGEESEK